MTRKPPVRHKVRSHKREGKPVRSFARGSGTPKKSPPKVVGNVDFKKALILAVSPASPAFADWKLIDYQIVGAKIHVLYKRPTFYRDERGDPIPVFEHKIFDSKKKVANPGQIYIARGLVAPRGTISNEEAKTRFRERIEGAPLYDLTYESGSWRLKTDEYQGSIEESPKSRMEQIRSQIKATPRKRGYSREEQDDQAFIGWYKLTGKTRRGKKILRREPTSSNIEIVAGVYKKQGAQNLKITQIQGKGYGN